MNIINLRRDMQPQHQIILKGNPTPQTDALYRSTGCAVMGNKPNGLAIPNWVTPIDPLHGQDYVWPDVVPWFEIYPGENYNASNTRVEVMSISLAVLNKDGWTELTRRANMWAKNQDSLYAMASSSPVDHLYDSQTGYNSFRLNTDLNPIHGALGRFTLPHPDSLKCLYVKLKCRLVLHDSQGVDDRAQAEVGICVGSDYYPDTQGLGCDYFANCILPAAMTSRFAKVQDYIVTVQAATISGSATAFTNSQWAQAGNSVLMCEQDFLDSNPYFVE